MQDQASIPLADRGSSATVLSGVLLAASVVFLTCLVLTRQGNLAWDDADYLRRGLADARHADAGPKLVAIPRLLDRLIRERPKPPFLVGWIALGALLVGRSHIDLLMVCSSVVPFLLLALATLSLARRLPVCRGGPAGGRAAAGVSPGSDVRWQGDGRDIPGVVGLAAPGPGQ